MSALPVTWKSLLFGDIENILIIYGRRRVENKRALTRVRVRKHSCVLNPSLLFHKLSDCKARASMCRTHFYFALDWNKEISSLSFGSFSDSILTSHPCISFTSFLKRSKAGRHFDIKKKPHWDKHCWVAQQEQYSLNEGLNPVASIINKWL